MIILIQIPSESSLWDERELGPVHYATNFSTQARNPEGKK